MRKIVSIGLLVIAVLVTVVPQANALSCAPPGPVKEEVERSNVVFKGKVTESENEGLGEEPLVFQVEKVWKGVTDPVIEIFGNGWDPYSEGKEYLIFGTEQDGKLITNLCGHTGPWDSERLHTMNDLKIKPMTFTKEDFERYSDQVNQAHEQTRISNFGWTVVLLFIIVAFITIVTRKMRRKV